MLQLHVDARHLFQVHLVECDRITNHEHFFTFQAYSPIKEATKRQDKIIATPQWGLARYTKCVRNENLVG